MTTTNLDTLTTEQLEMELKKRKAVLTKEKKKQMKQVQLDKDFLKWVNGEESKEAVEKRVEGWLEMIEAFCKAKKIPDSVFMLGGEAPEWYGGGVKEMCYEWQDDDGHYKNCDDDGKPRTVKEMEEQFDYHNYGVVFELLKEEFKKVKK
jgi:hypothetical protein